MKKAKSLIVPSKVSLVEEISKALGHKPKSVLIKPRNSTSVANFLRKYDRWEKLTWKSPTIYRPLACL